MLHFKDILYYSHTQCSLYRYIKYIKAILNYRLTVGMIIHLTYCYVVLCYL